MTQPLRTMWKTFAEMWIPLLSVVVAVILYGESIRSTASANADTNADQKMRIDKLEEVDRLNQREMGEVSARMRNLEMGQSRIEDKIDRILDKLGGKK